MAKFLIVGIDDPYGKTPLQPDIINSSGNKLWGMTGLTMGLYNQLFDRYNLYEVNEEHGPALGRVRAMKILNNIDKRYVNTYVICLGREVASAFGMYRAEPLKFRNIKLNTMGALVPHTSGVNRWYNEVANVRAATEFMQTVASVAAGEIDEYLINPELYDKIYESNEV